MKVTRKSLATGVERTLEIPCTEEQYAAWDGGMKIQDAMPDLSPADREFVMTGITQDEWDDMFPQGDEPDEDGEVGT